MDATACFAEIVIIGGSAAGLSAALILSSAQRSTIVVDDGKPRNFQSPQMHNYLTRDGVSPLQFLKLGREEVSKYGCSFVEDTVSSIIQHDFGSGQYPLGFEVTLRSGKKLTCRRVVVATGAQDTLPTLPGAAERFGRDILHCPYCHGYEVMKVPVGILYKNSMSLFQAQLARQWISNLTLLMDGEEDVLSEDEKLALSSRGIRIVTGKLSRVVVEDDKLVGVEKEDGSKIALEAIFVDTFPLKPNDALLRQLGAVTVNAGVFAIGNVVEPWLVITAVGDASRAALAINSELLMEDVKLAVAKAKQN